ARNQRPDPWLSTWSVWLLSGSVNYRRSVRQRRGRSAAGRLNRAFHSKVFCWSFLRFPLALDKQERVVGIEQRPDIHDTGILRIIGGLAGDTLNVSFGKDIIFWIGQIDLDLAGCLVVD